VFAVVLSWEAAVKNHNNQLLPTLPVIWWWSRLCSALHPSEVRCPVLVVGQLTTGSRNGWLQLHIEAAREPPCFLWTPAASILLLHERTQGFSVLLPPPRARPYLLGTFVHAQVHGHGHGMKNNSLNLLCFLHWPGKPGRSFTSRLSSHDRNAA
jgi:hypothetical protein